MEFKQEGNTSCCEYSRRSVCSHVVTIWYTVSFGLSVCLVSAVVMGEGSAFLFW